VTEKEFEALPRVEQDIWLKREIRAGQRIVREFQRRVTEAERNGSHGSHPLTQELDAWDERLIRLRHERDKVRARS
jgi:hypothetical protein